MFLRVMFPAFNHRRIVQIVITIDSLREIMTSTDMIVNLFYQIERFS
jgi:hypothetical protein